jgi:hypothetical protein
MPEPQLGAAVVAVAQTRAPALGHEHVVEYRERRQLRLRRTAAIADRGRIEQAQALHAAGDDAAVGQGRHRAEEIAAGERAGAQPEAAQAEIARSQAIDAARGGDPHMAVGRQGQGRDVVGRQSATGVDALGGPRRGQVGPRFDLDDAVAVGRDPQTSGSVLREVADAEVVAVGERQRHAREAAAARFAQHQPAAAGADPQRPFADSARAVMRSSGRLPTAVPWRCWRKRSQPAQRSARPCPRVPTIRSPARVTSKARTVGPGMPSTPPWPKRST